jgi:hypothetical protein
VTGNKSLTMIGRAGIRPPKPERSITSSANSGKFGFARNVLAVLAYALLAWGRGFDAPVLGTPTDNTGGVVPTEIIRATSLGTAASHRPPLFVPHSITSKKLLTPGQLVYKLYLVSSLIDLTPLSSLRSRADDGVFVPMQSLTNQPKSAVLPVQSITRCCCCLG